MTSPEPFAPQNDIDTDALIRDVLSALHPIMSWDGRGREISVVNAAGEFIVHHPFCWCDTDDCPWCAGDLEDLPEDVSAAAQKTHGFVDGEGAPNLWIRIGDIDARIWWYKSPGRSVRITGVADGDIAALRATCLRWLDDNSGSLFAAAATADIHNCLHGTAVPLATVLASNYATRYATAATAEDRAYITGELRSLESSLSAIMHACDQAGHVAAQLDAAGVPRHCDDPDLPPELRMQLSISGRLSWLLSTMDTSDRPAV